MMDAIPSLVKVDAGKTRAATPVAEGVWLKNTLTGSVTWPRPPSRETEASIRKLSTSSLVYLSAVRCRLSGSAAVNCTSVSME